ncbi:N-acetylglucosamine-1-phosphodiester alpha-N-acetylglucosaminidase [Mytilus galloprovincialis]|uniref:N-acetylglucosamine-1-phosphodiester alpha-N-acetylglucosaminidase n=1 Tax=Mytilus galloprovincialis TaxID=29158 RepID=A0A8B6BJR5_MYTGA|nr:N-acetylglucosamine-1-phosphodiester alpha-N-acetylglucosaminidase [Mytilus galloprovincialis]
MPSSNFVGLTTVSSQKLISDTRMRNVNLMMFESCYGKRIPFLIKFSCPAGQFGKQCLLSCVPNYYGVQCKKQCNCTDNTKCDPAHGCVCATGFTGSNCLNACPSGTYGVNCKEECFCSHDAECDSVTGDCLCPAGRFGIRCTKECPMGTFGINCSGICNCPVGETCDTITGNCNSPKDKTENPNSEIDDDKSNTVMVYILMAAALIGLICVVTMIVKVKETVCRQVQKPNKDTSKPKLKRRLAKRRRSSVQTQDAQTGSFIIDSEFSMLSPPMEEDVYCEIGDINTLEPNRY